MKQKYTILKDENTDGLTIKEHAELSKDLFSLICEETYEAEAIKEAIGKNKIALIDTLRTPNLYPISEYIDKIAEKVEMLYSSSGSPAETGPVELVFDDVELFRKEVAPEEVVSDESVEIEDLLEDDTEDEVADTEKDVPTPSLNTPDEDSPADDTEEDDSPDVKK